MLFFRVSSPLCWIGALVFFFLPWIEIRCDSKSSGHMEFSGAQLAWGGKTECVDGKIVGYTLGDLRALENSPELSQLFLLLNAYFVGLIVALFITLRRPPSRARGQVAFWIGLVLLALQFGAGCVLLDGNPFQHDESLTRWYYASCLTNVIAVLVSVGEWRCCRNPDEDAR